VYDAPAGWHIRLIARAHVRPLEATMCDASRGWNEQRSTPLVEAAAQRFRVDRRAASGRAPMIVYNSVWMEYSSSLRYEKLRSISPSSPMEKSCTPTTMAMTSANSAGRQPMPGPKMRKYAR